MCVCVCVCFFYTFKHINLQTYMYVYNILMSDWSSFNEPLLLSKQNTPNTHFITKWTQHYVQFTRQFISPNRDETSNSCHQYQHSCRISPDREVSKRNQPRQRNERKKLTANLKRQSPPGSPLRDRKQESPLWARDPVKGRRYSR